VKYQSSSSKFIKSLAAELGLPITNYFLNESQIKMMAKAQIQGLATIFSFLFPKVRYHIPIRATRLDLPRADYFYGKPSLEL